MDTMTINILIGVVMYLIIGASFLSVNDLEMVMQNYKECREEKKRFFVVITCFQMFLLAIFWLPWTLILATIIIPDKDWSGYRFKLRRWIQ